MTALIRRYLAAVLLAGLALAGDGGAAGGAEAAGAAAPAGPRISAPAAILLDWKTGTVLWQRNAFQKRDPASTTKIMTAVLVLERSELGERVTVSRRAALTPGSSMYLRQGQVLSVHDLLYGLLMRSGNDAAVALAEHVAGTVEAFAELMNEKARGLGMKNSQFRNPHGLTAPGHYTTAYDLALLTRHALGNQLFSEMVEQKQKELILEHLNKSVQLNNTNALLWSFAGADGVKTGTTGAAGACLVSSATRGEHRLIGVVLHAGNRWRDSAALLEWGYRNFRLVDIAHQGELVAEVAVAGGREPAVPVAVARDLAAVTPLGATEVPRIELQLPAVIEAPVTRGQSVGTAIVRWDGKVQGSVPVVTLAEVPRQTLLGRLLDLVLRPLKWLVEMGVPL